MHVLLTGATGNVGSHTLPELVRRGHRVRCLCRLTNANRRRAREFPAGAEVFWGDLTDPDGTVNVIAARPPRLLFTSTLDVHGCTVDSLARAALLRLSPYYRRRGTG